MSIAAALGAVGLAIKGIDEDNRKRAIQDEELANNREDRTMRRQVHELTFSQLTDKAAQEKNARTRLQAYNDLATTATNDEDFLNKKIAKAKELGDGEGMLATRDQLAKYKTAQLKTAVDGGLRRLIGTGDATGLQDAYNNLFPDGNKVAVTRTPDGKYDLQFVDKSMKVIASQPGMTADNLGMMAMKMMDPKFAEDVWKQQLKDEHALKLEDAKGENKLKRDTKLEESKARLGIAADDRRADREKDNIMLRGQLDLRNSGASAAAHGAESRKTASWKAGLDAYALEKQGAGGTDVKAQDQRVAKSTQIVHDYLKTDAFGGMNPTSQPLYIEAVRNAGQKVRAGADPETAAAEAIKEATAKVKAKATSGASPTIGLPSFK